MSLHRTVYTPDSPLQQPGRFVRAMFRDLGASRELAWRLFVRDVSARYRQTILGYVWAFLPPLVASATFIYLQSQGIVRVAVTPIPYAAFAMMGTLLWQVFVDAIQSPSLAVQSAKPMLAKINFPREALLMAGAYMVLFNSVVRLSLLVGVMVVWQIMPGAGVIMFPIAMLGLIACGFAVGLLLVPLGADGDVSRSIPIVAQFWMLLTPVVYPPRQQGMAGVLALEPRSAGPHDYARGVDRRGVHSADPVPRHHRRRRGRVCDRAARLPARDAAPDRADGWVSQRDDRGLERAPHHRSRCVEKFCRSLRRSM